MHNSYKQERRTDKQSDFETGPEMIALAVSFCNCTQPRKNIDICVQYITLVKQSLDAAVIATDTHGLEVNMSISSILSLISSRRPATGTILLNCWPRYLPACLSQGIQHTRTSHHLFSEACKVIGRLNSIQL